MRPIGSDRNSVNYRIMKAIGIRQARLTASLLALVALLAGFQLLAQETETEQPPPSGPLVLLYVDAPVALLSGIDPVFPAPVVVQAPEDDPQFRSRMDDIREYNLAVSDIEQSGGAWDRNLIEELVGLGNLQQQQGSHPEAIESFDRAIHVTRISAGLHTLEQIPAVERLIESYMALGDWEQADLYNYYLYYVQQKAYGSNDPRIIPVLDSLAKWNIEAFNIGYGESLGMRLSTAMILFNAAARMVGTHYGKSDERYVAYMKDIANSAYLVARHPELMVELRRPENRNSQQLLREQLDIRSPELPAGFSSGERALLSIINFYVEQEDAATELAEALTNLGDWYLLFGRRRPATERYTQAWQFLSTIEDGDSQLQQLFAQVVPLPTFANQAVNYGDADSVKDRDSGSRSSAYADFAFDVTEYGTVRNIRMLNEPTSQTSTLLGRIRRHLRNTYFRPVIKEGKPVRANGNRFRYRYWY